MKSFHSRLQFFVLLYIESSSYIDHSDEIWEVMTLFRRKDIRDPNNDNDSNETIGARLRRRVREHPTKSKKKRKTRNRRSRNNNSNSNETDTSSDESESSDSDSSSDSSSYNETNNKQNKNKSKTKEKQSDTDEEEDSDIEMNLRSKTKSKRKRNTRKSKSKSESKTGGDDENDSGSEDEKEDDREKGLISRTYETLGYMTLYRFFAWPDKRRLRVSQVIIFPPFQRQRHGFELLQHVYLMSKYRNFIEVNVEDPAIGFQFLRDVCDVYNCYKLKLFDENDFSLNSVDPNFISFAAYNPKNPFTNHEIINNEENGTNNGNANGNMSNNSLMHDNGSASMSILSHFRLHGNMNNHFYHPSQSMSNLGLYNGHNAINNNNNNSNNNNSNSNRSNENSNMNGNDSGTKRTRRTGTKKKGNNTNNSNSNNNNNNNNNNNIIDNYNNSGISIYNNAQYWDPKNRLPREIYHEPVMFAANLLKITPVMLVIFLFAFKCVCLQK